MGSTPYSQLRRLTAMTRSGELETLCREEGIALLVVFGSVLVPGDGARDIDLAARFETGAPDVLGVLDQLARRGVSAHVDLMVLNRAGPVARERALVRGRPLFQLRPGEFAVAQIAAIMERLDTDWLRALDLELMAR